MSIQIAIDGPAGAGKSTISKYVAKSLGYIYIDTGSMYRAFAWFLIKDNTNTDDESKIKNKLNKFDLKLERNKDNVRILVNNIDVTNKIRTNEISLMASKIATIKEVRYKMVQIQRKIAKNKSVVMDGRDIGTHVLINADVKIFLTASTDDRAKRRYEEMKAKGLDVSYEKIKREIEYRDQNDSSRKISPLKKADDAYKIDTSGNSLEKSKRIILNFVKDKIKEIAK